MNVQDYVGRSQEQTDTVWPPLARGLAATLGADEPAQVLPPLWHWMLFQDWVRPDAVGADGHPRRGGFLPALEGLARRMWAGGRVRFLQPLHVGEPVSRITTIQSVAEKAGASGELVFVTLRHVIAGAAGTAIEEEQDLVYRGAEGEAVKAAAPGPAVDVVCRREVTPGPVLLFRYSALTGNSHRIHYDADYVRAEEGYPGLVVHGPLQATWLAALAGEALQAPVAQFNYRGRRPAFVGKTLRLEAWRLGETMHARSLDPDGAVCMTAEARA